MRWAHFTHRLQCEWVFTFASLRFDSVKKYAHIFGREKSWINMLRLHIQTGVWRYECRRYDTRILWFHEAAEKKSEKTRIMIAACLFCVFGGAYSHNENVLHRNIIIIRTWTCKYTSKWTQIGEWMNRRATRKLRERERKRRCEKVPTHSLSASAKASPATHSQFAVWTMQRVHNLTNGRWFSWNYKRFIINKVLKSLHIIFYFIFVLVIYVIFPPANIHFH